jgi:predicted site-specific integrase-resolvase
LERQIQFFRREFPDHEIIKDIGSGLNTKRKGFNTILDEGIKGNIKEVVVTHRDRFCRFNFEVFERIINQYSNGTILVLDKKEGSSEEEIVRDLLEIVKLFSSRVHGLRSHSLKRKIENSKNKDIPKSRRESKAETDV